MVCNHTIIIQRQFYYMPKGVVFCLVVEYIYVCVCIIFVKDIGIADVGTATRLICSMLTYQSYACFTHHLFDIDVAFAFHLLSLSFIFPNGKYTTKYTVDIFRERTSKIFSLAKLLWLHCLHQWMVFFYGLLNLKLVWHY